MKSNKSGLMLLELVISLVMFTFCAAICVRLFHFASQNTKRADELTQAVRISESIAEILKTDEAESQAEILLTVYPQAVIEGNYFRAEYNADWLLVKTGDSSAVYSVRTTYYHGAENNIEVTVIESDELIFTLRCMGVSVNG